MFSYLLNCLYLLAALAASPWLLYQAITKGKYREGFAEKLLGLVPPRQGDRPCFWLHAVSVGEVNLLEPLLAELDRRLPQWECVISTTTMTGLAQARKKYAGRTVFYAPLDFSWAVSNALTPHSPRRAGAGGAGVVAEPDLRGPAARRRRGDRQRPLERSQLSRLSAAGTVHPRPAGAD